MSEKCPICAGTVSQNVCTNCGYTLPDESKLAAQYKYEPQKENDMPQIEPMYEEMPAVGEVSESPVPPKKPQIKVADIPPAAVVPEPDATPFETAVKIIADHLRKFWWLYVIVFLVPSTGFIFSIAWIVGLALKSKRYDSYWVLVPCAVFFVLGILLGLAGWDPIGLDKYVSEYVRETLLTDDEYY